MMYLIAVHRSKHNRALNTPSNLFCIDVCCLLRDIMFFFRIVVLSMSTIIAEEMGF